MALDTPSRGALPERSNASQALQRQVANSFFNAPSSSTGSPPGVIEEPVSNHPPQPTRPAQPVKQVLLAQNFDCCASFSHTF